MAIELAVSGKAAVDGSIVIVVMNPDAGTGTFASIGDDSTVHTGGNLVVRASDTDGPLDPESQLPATGIQLVRGSGQYRREGYVRLSAAILVRNSTVLATIGDHADVAAADISVTAEQAAGLLLLAIGGSAGVNAGVGGSATVEVLNNVTTAGIGSDTLVNCVGAGASTLPPHRTRMSW